MSFSCLKDLKAGGLVEVRVVFVVPADRNPPLIPADRRREDLARSASSVPRVLDSHAPPRGKLAEVTQGVEPGHYLFAFLTTSSTWLDLKQQWVIASKRDSLRRPPQSH